jgi:hypothetical protein
MKCGVRSASRAEAVLKFKRSTLLSARRFDNATVLPPPAEQCTSSTPKGICSQRQTRPLCALILPSMGTNRNTQSNRRSGSHRLITARVIVIVDDTVIPAGGAKKNCHVGLYPPVTNKTGL